MVIKEYEHNKLMGLMREKKISQETLAKGMGISITTLSKKLHGKVDFTTKEVFLAMKVLGIDNPMSYFFEY